MSVACRHRVQRVAVRIRLQAGPAVPSPCSSPLDHRAAIRTTPLLIELPFKLVATRASAAASLCRRAVRKAANCTGMSVRKGSSGYRRMSDHRRQVPVVCPAWRDQARNLRVWHLPASNRTRTTRPLTQAFSESSGRASPRDLQTSPAWRGNRPFPPPGIACDPLPSHSPSTR